MILTAAVIQISNNAIPLLPPYPGSRF